MNVLVVGANGQIGRQVVDLLKEKEGYTPIAFVRKDEQVVDFEENKGVEARLGNLEDTREEIAKRMENIDSIVFAAGSGGSTGPDKTILIDLDGAVKVMDAARDSNIDRLVLVSAYKADDRGRWNEDIAHYYAAKHYADRFLMNSGLDYTILRPGLLTNEEGAGSIKVIKEGDDEPENREIPRADVAQTAIESLENDNSIGKAIDMVTGETSIKDAVNNL